VDEYKPLLTALRELFLIGNQLTSIPAELGRLTALKQLCLIRNQLESVPAALGVGRCKLIL